MSPVFNEASDRLQEAQHMLVTVKVMARLDSSHVPAGCSPAAAMGRGKADAQIVQFVKTLRKDIEALEGRYSYLY